jgi:hypothetical protein
MSESGGPIVSQPGQGEIVRIPLGRDIVIKASTHETGGAYSILEFTAPSAASGRSHICTVARKRVGTSSRVS